MADDGRSKTAQSSRPAAVVGSNGLINQSINNHISIGISNVNAQSVLLHIIM